jgi:hypothetical protein
VAECFFGRQLVKANEPTTLHHYGLLQVQRQADNRAPVARVAKLEKRNTFLTWGHKAVPAIDEWITPYLYVCCRCGPPKEPRKRGAMVSMAGKCAAKTITWCKQGCSRSWLRDNHDRWRARRCYLKSSNAFFISPVIVPNELIGGAFISAASASRASKVGGSSATASSHLGVLNCCSHGNRS